MQTSKAIVVVKKVPEAPIFELADYGIVCDVFTFAPQVTEEIKKREAQAARLVARQCPPARPGAAWQLAICSFQGSRAKCGARALRGGKGARGPRAPN